MGLDPGRRLPRQRPVPGSYSAIWPAFHSLTHRRPLESAHTRRAPCRAAGGSRTDTLPPAGLIRAMELPAGDAWDTNPAGVGEMPDGPRAPRGAKPFTLPAP